MFRILVKCWKRYNRTILWACWLLPICWSTDCPNTNTAECTCPNENYIDCRGNKPGKTKLTTVPTFVHSNVPYRGLDLCGNSIAVVHNNAFESLRISELDITDNPIVSFDINAFGGIHNTLTKLSFSLSETGQFPDTSQITLNSLTSLYVIGYRSSSGHLATNALTGYTSLVDLSVTKGSLSQLVPEDFHDLGNSLTTLDLSENAFTDIPASALRVLSKLETLVINENPIRFLLNSSFEGLALKSLTMTDFSNLMIASGSFLPLQPSLTAIRMQNCQLQDQSIEAIRMLTNVKVLELQHNKITNILSLFDKMEDLTSVNLEYNELGYLRKESFNGVADSLKILTLRHNTKLQLHPNVFQMLRSLEILCLENVPGTSSLNNLSFSSQRESLKEISIESNMQIDGKQKICPPWNVFNEIRSLVTLNLKGCRMGNIPEYTFRLTTKLEKLNLESNGIDTLSMPSLAGLEGSLQYLYLRDNKISKLDQCVLHNFAVLTQLQLANNPLHCECNITWLNKLFKASYDEDWMCMNLDEKSFKKFVTDHLDTCDAKGSSTTESPCYDWHQDFTTQPTPSIKLRLVEATENGLRLEWNIMGISDSNIAGFYLTSSPSNDRSLESTTEITDPMTRQYILNDLASDTRYTVCIGIREATSRIEPSCVEVATIILSETNNLSIIIGASVAGILVIIVFCTVCCCLHRHRKEKAQQRNFIKQTPETPQLAGGTKRFVKPDLLEGQPGQSQIAKSQSIADQLDAIPDDTKYKLLTILNQCGGSMASLDHLDYSRSQRGTLPYGLGGASKSMEYLGNSYSLERRARRPSVSASNIYNTIEDEVYDEIDV